MGNKEQRKCGNCGGALPTEGGLKEAAAGFENVAQKFGAYFADPAAAGLIPEEKRKYDDAVLYASEKHKSQERDDGTPYILHPIRVARTLRSTADCRDVDVLCAAILHDTIEDSNASYDELAKRFGRRVARFVAELTMDKRLPKHCRTRIMLETARQKSSEYRLIKLADRLDNLSDMNGWDKARRQTYCESTADLLKAHQGTHKGLETLIRKELLRRGVKCSFCGRIVAGLENEPAQRCRLCSDEEQFSDLIKDITLDES
jgi:GTP diphosphokinase / guanosine-3',5'-bis(diphosphate) 3'-diphosphatase